MKQIWFVGLALAAILATATVAKADTFGFVFSGSAVLGVGPSISGSGTLTADLITPGTYCCYYDSSDSSYDLPYTIGSNVYNVTGGNFTISYNGGPATTAYIMTNTSPGNVDFSDDYYYFYDNIIAPTGTLTPSGSPFITDFGILLNLTGDVQNSGVEIDLAYDDYGDAYNGQYVWSGYNYAPGAGAVINDTYDELPLGYLEVTPEPSSLMLLGTGLLCMAGFLFWKAKPSMVRVR
jgi:hypothetical protein